MTPGGIDIMILRGPTLDQILAALTAVCGLKASDVIRPGDDIMQRMDVWQKPLRATILTLTGGDCAFKVDIDGVAPRDYPALARQLAAEFEHGVVILDEDKRDPISAIFMRPGAPDAHGFIEVAEPDGFWFRHGVSRPE